MHPDNVELVLQQALRYRQNVAQGALEYVAHKIELLTRAGYVDDVTNIPLIVNGLQRHIAADIRKSGQRPRTVMELQEMVERIETAYTLYRADKQDVSAKSYVNAPVVFGDNDDDPAGYYLPLAQRDPRFVSLALRTAGADPLTLTPAVRQAVTALNPNLPIYNVDSMKGIIREQTWFYYVFGTLFIAFGAAALFMATVGLYGVLSFSVSRRTREMGIRMALGATGRDVIRLVLRQGGKQIAVGLGVGLLLALGVTRVIGLLMFEVTPQDPPVFSVVILMIAAVGLLASLVPARRATRTHPTAALRYE
jgi:hypothetical protein